MVHLISCKSKSKIQNANQNHEKGERVGDPDFNIGVGTADGEIKNYDYDKELL